MRAIHATAGLSEKRAEQAIEALVREVQLTPKPGLIDQNDNGIHRDMDLTLMYRSAQSLRPSFNQIANVATNQTPSQDQREKIAEVGREGEKEMFSVTGGVNTHKGAIWALGLLTAASVFYTISEKKPNDICRLAAELARFPDKRYSHNGDTNGKRVQRRFNVRGARGEAEKGFPHVINIGLPMLKSAREKGLSENGAQLYTLLAIIAALDDTCILYRGGEIALQTIQGRARNMIEQERVNHTDVQQLNDKMIELGVSPGGSGDLLAATLFLDMIENQGG